MSNKVVDRWFPCSEVTEAAARPHGSGRIEKALFTWFASRPVAQARAAVLTTLLDWPDSKQAQDGLKSQIVEAIRGNGMALKALAADIKRSGKRVVDPFSGRGIIPLEAGRAGAEAWGVDYSPVATLAGHLLGHYPFRDWSTEPPIVFNRRDPDPMELEPRIIRDMGVLLNEICDRHEQALDPFYPRNAAGQRPWAYLWAQSIPCSHCDRRFPLIGSSILRYPNTKTGDLGQSIRIVADRNSGELTIQAVDGLNLGSTTIVRAPAGNKNSRVARCSFCGHSHGMETIKSKAAAGVLRDMLLLVADLDKSVGKRFRTPRPDEIEALVHAEQALLAEAPFGDMPAVPHEAIPAGNHDTIRASLYGARTYGDLCCTRQTLAFVALCRVIGSLDAELATSGVSQEYRRAVLGYAGALLTRKLRRSTRGATLLAHNDSNNRVQVHDVFKNQASINHSYDFLEAGIGLGPGTLRSLADDITLVLKRLSAAPPSKPPRFTRGSALRLPFRNETVDAVITDPPYYNMIDYLDASDLFYVWLKRALGDIYPELFDTGEELQAKAEEIIVKRGGVVGEHRTEEFYRSSLQKAFLEIRRILRPNGVLALVFGHGAPEAWVLLLQALSDAGFVITGSWPARTESETYGGGAGANIKVTVTISCRVAPSGRRVGLQAAVDHEVHRAVQERAKQWERENLALPDQLMASYGPAMEVVGRYERILRADGSAVKLEHYLSLARLAVQDSIAMKVDGLPLETFDVRTRFALFWARTYPNRAVAARSEAAFHAMTSSMRLDDVREGILQEQGDNGYCLAKFHSAKISPVSADSAIVDVVRSMVQAWVSRGGDGVSEVLQASQRDPQDTYLWAVVNELPRFLPVGDVDRKSLEDITRNRRAIVTGGGAKPPSPPASEQLTFNFDSVEVN